MEHGDALTILLREVFKQKHSDEWLQLLKHDHGLPIEREATFSDLLHDEHLAMNGVLRLPLTTLALTGSSMIHNVRGGRRWAPACSDLGRYDEDILRDLGFSADDIETLKSKGVI